MESAIAKTKIRTLRLKVKPEAYPWLDAAAQEVNFVWNWANETSEKAVRRYVGKAKWLSAFDLINLSSGASKYFDNIGADVICRVCQEFAAKRLAAKKARLSWRRSGGARKSLGWIPVRSTSLRRKARSIRFLGKTIRVFEFEKLQGLQWRDGQFAQDAVGDWWMCLPIREPVSNEPAPREIVGIDLGLKDTAMTSDGGRLAAGRYLRNTEDRIAQAQRRGHKRQEKRLYRKAARQRKDALHKFTTGIVDQYQNIVVGDVSVAKFVKTRMAKSVLDSGWGMLKQMLQYKGERAGRSVQVVNEAYTTRACSSCGQLTGPSGLRQLAVRTWRCSACETEHDRDVNAAKNIAKLGLRHPTSIRGNDPKGTNAGSTADQSVSTIHPKAPDHDQ